MLSFKPMETVGDTLMDTESNPYATQNGASPATVTTESQAVDFRPVMQRWEHLRLYYNVILVVFVILFAVFELPRLVTFPAFWIVCFVGGVVANLCFLVAPAIEAYSTCLNIWQRWMTLVLFLAGLAFTAILAEGFLSELNEVLLSNSP